MDLSNLKESKIFCKRLYKHWKPQRKFPKSLKHLVAPNDREHLIMLANVLFILDKYYTSCTYALARNICIKHNTKIKRYFLIQHKTVYRNYFKAGAAEENFFKITRLIKMKYFRKTLLIEEFREFYKVYYWKGYDASPAISTKHKFLPFWKSLKASKLLN